MTYTQKIIKLQEITSKVHAFHNRHSQDREMGVGAITKIVMILEISLHNWSICLLYKAPLCKKIVPV